ncbi:filamentous hemagglutinin N-terminal domain-containing protein [Sulfuritalea sp.]|uniref:two-partner secretion domain-containing protein n=1 Tax=Sulfuritalea sp. TaxID=2480090 RepID=UPI00286E2D0C|nr:filamentous hemagglutinin N-terminal domain-containing protein [Sulfuritalea sp.]
MDRTNPFTRLPAARPLAKRGFPTIARSRMVAALATAFAAQFALAAAPAPTALPTGGQVVAGQASIQQAGAAMTIRQATDQAILNWQTFNIGASASVNFIQPSASSIALNRVLGSDPSAIYGQLTANGQVFLVNPSGVLFGPGARVDVAGLVASTLAIRDADFLDRNYRFTRDGATGSVVNQGEIVGQYVALLAPEVRNEGVIAARMGTVALAAGDAVTLGISGQRLVDVQVDKASIDTLVENRHLIRAEEGMVVLSAQSAHTLLGRVVNSGAVEANGISTDGGTIRLLASSTVDHSGSIAADGAANASGGTAILLADLANPASRTTVSGSITARGGSASGDGGFIETSGHRVSIADSARIDAGAPRGRSGLWLLDPEDFTIALAGGDITGVALGAALGANSVTIQTGTGVNTATDFFGTAGANGDIFVNASVTWGTANTLTMKAHRNINVNSEINVNGTGTLLLNYDNANGGGDYFVRAPINLAAGALFKTQRETDAVVDYITVRTNAELNTLATTGDKALNYALGTNVTATTNPWVPIGDSGAAFTGKFDGLGHTVDGLTRPNTDNATTGIGLFGQSDGEIRNVGVTNVNVAGSQNVGGLAGINNGIISNSYSTGTVTGSDVTGAFNEDQVGSIGGLVGRNDGNIIGSYSSVAVTATSGDQGAGGAMNFTQGGIGGLAGSSQGPITNSYATGAVTGGNDVGGLVGFTMGAIGSSYSTGAVAGGNNLGGLVGFLFEPGPPLLTDTFWDTTTSTQGLSSTGTGTSTGLATADMKVQANFTNWDFTDTWVIRENNSTPLLRGMLPPLFVIPTAQTKIYDGAVFGGAHAATFSTPAGGKTAGAADFTGGTWAAGINAGAYTIPVSGITLASNTDQHGFLSVTAVDGTLTITPKALTADTAGVVNTKVYNGNTTAAGAALLASEAVGAGTTADGKPYTGDTVSITGNGAFDFKDAGVATTISFVGLGLGGAQAGNYLLTPAADINGASITKLALAITDPVVANKTFDGATTATVNDPGVLSGFVGIETVTRAVNTANFDTAVIGVGKNVTVNYTLGNGTNGGLAANYSLADKVVMADITAAAPPPAPAPVPEAPAATTTAVETVVTKTEEVRKDLCAAVRLGNEVCGQVSVAAPLASTSRLPVPSVTIAVAPAGAVAANSLRVEYTQNKSGAYPVRVPSADSGGRSVLTARQEVVGTVSGGQSFNFTLPDDTFTHTNPNAVVSLSARQANGQPLPSWVRFDPQSGSISGTPPAGIRGNISIQVQARDRDGNEVSTILKLNLGQGSAADTRGPRTDA